MKIFVDENLVGHGIEKVVVAKAGNVQVKAPLDPEVEAKIKNVEQEVLDGKKDWILNDPITQGYENLVTSCNRTLLPASNAEEACRILIQSSIFIIWRR